MCSDGFEWKLFEKFSNIIIQMILMSKWNKFLIYNDRDFKTP